ncbi:hypothetical protein [Dyella sp. EPa41]|uniref:hypothetical protein n=1 Tax=Dyella sp. EPa41 TaxID=1561194 RepID=UPI001916B47A|nr:hypothetical protein [Dyella sp. EPa41]
MSGQNVVVEPKALPALHRNQRRFLYLGGAVVTLLMVATIFAIALSSIRDYHRQQREIFQEAGTDIDALLARLKLQHRNAMRVFSSLWLTQQPWLQSVGAPLQKQFAAQDGQLLIQVDPPNQPWLILGVDTTGLPDATQAAILGLAREASTLAPAARGGKPGTRAYVYDPLGRMFGIEGVDTEAQLLGALHVQTRKQALERLMLADDRWQREAVHAMGAPAVDNRVAPLFLGHDPLTGEPAIVEGLRLPFAPDSGSRAIVFESLGQLVESLSPPASVRLVSATDETILGENQAPDVHKADPALLQELHDHLPRHHGPVLFSKGGMYKVAGTLRNADWTLVRLYSRQQMLVDIGHRLLPFLLVTALILAILWTLLLYTDRRVFAPALAGVERVYESEALSRIIIEASPVGLCLLDPENHQPIMENDVMRGFAADSAEPPSSLYARLAAGAPAKPAGPIAGIRPGNWNSSWT